MNTTVHYETSALVYFWGLDIHFHCKKNCKFFSVGTVLFLLHSLP